MSSKEREILERYANWHPNTPSLKSADEQCGGCTGCGSCSTGAGCGGTGGSCSQCGGCTFALYPSLGERRIPRRK